MSVFFANYRYHPRMLVHATVESANPSVEALTVKLQAAQTELNANLSIAQERYKAQYNRHTQPVPEHKVGDKFWLLQSNIHTTRPSQKLDVRRMGPFRILEVVGDAKSVFRLELPHQMKIHNVFHVSLLEPYQENTFEGRVQAPPPLEEVDGVEEFQVKEIVDSKVSWRKLLYLVEWEGYGPNDRTWEPVKHLTHGEEAVTAYHRRFPQRPAPHNIPQRPASPRCRRRW